jgi:uncharacterized membrane protein/protein-disulfide isomerase
MSPTSTHIRLPGAVRSTNTAGAGARPAFSLPVRITLAVLSWVAFGLASYLAFHSVSGTSVAGCGVGSENGCDVVLQSAWSKWIGIPVAVLGLACYAALASLAVLMNWRSRRWNPIITTAFVALAVLAAGASLWFIGLQLFKIGEICKFCLATDICGFVIGAIALGAAVYSAMKGGGKQAARGPQPGLLGVKPAAKAVASTVPAVATTAPSAHAAVDPPSIAASFGIAVPLLVLLIGGQFLFAAKTFQVEKLALTNSFKMDESADPKVQEGDVGTGTTRVALRVPSESESARSNPGENADPSANADGTKPSTPNAAEEKSGSSNTAAPPAEPAKKRLVKFLGGKLVLDTYKHPLIGSPEAPHVVVEMVSYDCPHCRKMHAFMQEALDRYGDQVAIIIMPIPLDKECNKLITDAGIKHPEACGTAKRAIAIARLAPSMFVKFHDFLMTGKEKPPSMEKIIPKANGLVDSEMLRTLSRGPEVKKQLESYVDLFGQLQSQSSGNKNFGLPVQILGDQVMTGSVEKSDDVFKAWEEHLGVKPR